MSRPLVDITTLNAVESLFRRGERDPWAKQLAGELADLFIYSDTVRYSITVPSGASPTDELIEKPSLLLDLGRRDPAVFVPEKYSTAEPVLLKEEYLEECFDRFSAWARSNRATLRRWITLHNESWIQIQRATRVEHQYVFSLDALRKDPALEAITKEIEVDQDDICYAFDIVLRYPLYGELVGENEHYLNHPIRDAFPLPTMQRERGSVPGIAVSFKDSIATCADNLSQDEYTALLYELRGIVRQYGLHKVKPGEFDKETIREIAAKVALPPRLRATGKLAAIGAGLIGGLGAIPVLGPAAAVAGAAVSVSAALWTGRLPRAAARMKWLRWALGWGIEDQAEERE